MPRFKPLPAPPLPAWLADPPPPERLRAADPAKRITQRDVTVAPDRTLRLYVVERPDAVERLAAELPECQAYMLRELHRLWHRGAAHRPSVNARLEPGRATSPAEWADQRDARHARLRATLRAAGPADAAIVLRVVAGDEVVPVAMLSAALERRARRLAISR